MIRHLGLRLAASALTLATVLQPHAARAQAVAAPAVTLPHISIVEQGKGSPIVLIPGLASPRAVWDGIAPHLARTHRVIVVQVNGFAGDPPGDTLKPGLLDGIVADLHGYLAARRLTGAAVVGHSMGGLVSMMLAKAHPGDVGRLMIVDSLPYIGELFLPGVAVAQVEPRARAMRDQIAAGYGKPADPAAADATAGGLTATPAARATVKRWAMAADPRVTAAAMYEDMTTDLRPDVAALTLPITLVYPAAGDALYHRAYAKAPHVTYVPVADSGHFVMLDQPAAFAAAVETFQK